MELDCSACYWNVPNKDDDWECARCGRQWEIDGNEATLVER